ncbi:MAG: 2-C-methyl-D-erythritol 4-phosphate cytidylyltransferase [Planctomycetes bacterium]|nr:2-C-methyl-D-erythritol 4-phosphate cytidylyltransferase [Planctomycetota bacterium]
MEQPGTSAAARPRVAAVVVAAGAGRRMGARENKVFLDLCGQPILARTIAALARSRRIHEIVLVTRAEDREEARRIAAAAAGPSLPLRLAEGGAERGASVRSGVAAAPLDADILLVHDAARPFVSARLIGALIDAAERHGAAIPALPVADTLKRARAGVILETVSREELFSAQTPQAFRAELLRDALARPAPAGGAPTDDALLLERAGREVHIVPGDPANLKITTPQDLALARALLPAFDAELGAAGASP